MASEADVCMIFEGSYPFISGGVSHWAHDFIKQQNHLKFHLVCIEPPLKELKPVYEVPENVIGINVIKLQKLAEGSSEAPQDQIEKLFRLIELPLLKLQLYGRPKDFKELVDAVDSFGIPLGSKLLLDSETSWKMTLRMYRATMGYSSFLNFYYSWRGLISSFFSILLSEVPPAKIYHATSTGYSGLYLTFAKLRKQRPCLVTEHGIYTNERRIEITLADWLYDEKSMDLVIDSVKEERILNRVLKDYWIDTFYGYSKLCYESSEKIITLFDGNQEYQIADGADPARMQVIPNGVNVEKYSKVIKESGRPPTVALIGRVVPIKDIKSFLHAVSLLVQKLPEAKAYVIGPTDEDPEYYQECVQLMHHLNLGKYVTFTGKVNTVEYLAKIDLVCLTSISEAQPLVILEAGAAGIPVVATDAGCCGELIFGTADETPKLGPGGALSPLYSPASIADNMLLLLSDKTYYEACSKAIRERVTKYYNAAQVTQSYKSLYDQLLRN